MPQISRISQRLYSHLTSRRRTHIMSSPSASFCLNTLTPTSKPCIKSSRAHASSSPFSSSHASTALKTRASTQPPRPHHANAPELSSGRAHRFRLDREPSNKPSRATTAPGPHHHPSPTPMTSSRKWGRTPFRRSTLSGGSAHPAPLAPPAGLEGLRRGGHLCGTSAVLAGSGMRRAFFFFRSGLSSFVGDTREGRRGGGVGVKHD